MKTKEIELTNKQKAKTIENIKDVLLKHEEAFRKTIGESKLIISKFDLAILEDYLKLYNGDEFKVKDLDVSDSGKWIKFSETVQKYIYESFNKHGDLTDLESKDHLSNHDHKIFSLLHKYENNAPKPIYDFFVESHKAWGHRFETDPDKIAIGRDVIRPSGTTNLILADEKRKHDYAIKKNIQTLKRLNLDHKALSIKNNAYKHLVAWGLTREELPGELFNDNALRMATFAKHYGNVDFEKIENSVHLLELLNRNEKDFAFNVNSMKALEEYIFFKDLSIDPSFSDIDLKGRNLDNITVHPAVSMGGVKF